MTPERFLMYCDLVEKSHQKTILNGETFNCYPNAQWKHSNKVYFFSKDITGEEFDTFCRDVILMLLKLSTELDLSFTYNWNDLQNQAEENYLEEGETDQFYFDFAVLYDDKDVYEQFKEKTQIEAGTLEYILGFNEYHW